MLVTIQKIVLLQASLLTTKIAAAESRIQRLTTELERRPPASAAAAMTAQISALSQLLGQQLEAEGWGTDAAAAAVAALAVPGQLEPIMQASVVWACFLADCRGSGRHIT